MSNLLQHLLVDPAQHFRLRRLNQRVILVVNMRKEQLPRRPIDRRQFLPPTDLPTRTPLGVSQPESPIQHSERRVSGLFLPLALPLLLLAMRDVNGLNTPKKPRRARWIDANALLQDQSEWEIYRGHNDGDDVRSLMETPPDPSA